MLGGSKNTYRAPRNAITCLPSFCWMSGEVSEKIYKDIRSPKHLYETVLKFSKVR